MKKLSISQVETIEGGGFWDGVCGGVTAVGASLGLAGVVLAPGPALAIGLAVGVCFAANYR